MPKKPNNPNDAILDALDAVNALAREAQKVASELSSAVSDLPHGADRGALHHLAVAANDFRYAVEHSEITELRRRLN